MPDDQAQPLAVQSLRYLYRILFLLYAEASPELGVLPDQAFNALVAAAIISIMVFVPKGRPRADAGGAEATRRSDSDAGPARSS